MKIEIKKIQQITEKLFSHLQDTGYKELEVSEDFYWEIKKENRYDSYEEPKDLTLGQLSDDYCNLLKCLEDNNIVNYNFVWLSAIIRLIGDKLP